MDIAARFIACEYKMEVAVSHMSHDIRTSVNGIIGMTDLAIKSYNDKNRKM